MRSRDNYSVPFYSPSGEFIAHVIITPAREDDKDETAPLSTAN